MQWFWEKGMLKKDVEGGCSSWQCKVVVGGGKSSGNGGGSTTSTRAQNSGWGEDSWLDKKGGVKIGGG